MIIPEIKLSNQELCDAVHAYLSARGITVPVEQVEKNYTSSGAWRIELKEPKPEPDTSAIVEPIDAPIKDT